MTPSPVHPLSPSLDGDERPPDPEPHATSTSPIPTSAPLFAETRQLASSSSSLASSSSSTPSPLFPASPPVDGSSRWESEGRRASKSARSKTSARSMSPAPKPQALPRHIVLPAAPHSLPTTALIQLLPFEHALALVQTLSAKVEAQQADLLRTQKEVAVLEKLALEKGAGKGEVERARVRARADASVDEVNKVKYIDGNAIASSGNAAEWKIELTTPAEAPNAATTPGDVEVALNLDELAEAISDNAYDFGSPVLPTFALADLDGTLKARRDHADDGASISRLSVASNGSAVSAPVPTSTSKGVDKSAGRARHASLSSRIFGSLTLPSTSSPPPPPPAVPQQPVYDSEAAAPATASASVSQTASSKLTKKNKNRHQRSDSLKSVDSAASARSIVDKGETLSSAGGYGDWIWGKGWAKSRSQHQQQHRRDQDSESVAEEADGSISTPAADSITPTPDRINQILAANGDTSERSTDKEGTPPSPSLLSLTSPSHGQTAGSSIPTSPSSTSLLAPSSPTLSRRSDQDPRRPSITAERGTAPDPSKAEVASVLVTAQHLSPTASRTSSVSRDGPSRELRGTTDEDDDAHPTIRARRDSTGSKRVPPFLSVATPLYSADDASAQPLSPPGGRSYVASAKGTIGRALGLGASASSSGGLSPPTMVRSASEGLRRASGGTAEVSTTMEPNLTLFPRLASMSKYSPFAQPRLSTPSTPISLSSHSSPIVASSASAAAAAHPSSSASMHANISAPTTMELSTLSAEAPPPALSGQNVSSGQTDSRDEAAEPLVDRYGFVYDVKSGMKLLREARRHKERLARGDATMDGDDALQAAAALLEPREPASTAPAGSQPNPTHDADSSNPSARAPHLVRSDSDASGGDAAAQTPAPGPTSMKLLLTTLRDMSNALEQSQKVAWDSFIRRRQAVLVQRSRSAAAGSKDESSSAAAKEDKRRRKERDRARRDRPRTIAHDLNPNDALGGEGDLDADVAVEEKDWTEDLVGVSQMGLSGKSGKEDWAEFKDLVRKGVPIAYRPKIWAECSGANEAREPGTYQDLLSQHRGEDNQCLNQIDMDCHRTFPTNVFFAGNGPGVAKLRNVLVAYSWRNPKIGYCQGMNNLTATLLLTYPSEEEAFWVLVCIIEKILPSDYYTSHLLVSQADQRVLKDLIEKLEPDIAGHLEDLGVELPAVTFGWFLSLFTDSLPIQTLLRIWDLIFVLGTVMLFRVAVAIMQMHREDILACDSAAGLYALMRSMTAHLFHADKLLKIACEDLRPLIKDRDISVLRDKHARELQAELGISPEEDDRPAGRSF